MHSYVDVVNYVMSKKHSMKFALCIYMYIFMIDFSSFDIMLLHLKLQTCFVLLGLLSTIRYANRFLYQNNNSCINIVTVVKVRTMDTHVPTPLFGTVVPGVCACGVLVLQQGYQPHSMLSRAFRVLF